MFLALAVVCADILCVGPGVFWVESLGTLMLSPSVYVTLLPRWLAHPLAHSLYVFPALNLVICAIPLLMLAGATIFGALGFRRNSMTMALLACGLVATVFVVYHFVQPMGFRVVN